MAPLYKAPKRNHTYGQGRHPELAQVMMIWHRPFLRALARFMKANDYKSRAKALGELALKNPELNRLYKEELTKQDNN